MFRSETRRFVFIVTLAFLHGLTYLLLVPAWQHYDEPNHFEHAWLAAHQNHLPQPGDFNQQLSQQVIESMIVTGFYRDISPPPGLFESLGKDMLIPGFSQLDEPPLYYMVASLPLRVMAGSPIEYQLAAVRGVSLLLYLAIIWLAWRIMIEVTQPGNTLRWLVPFILAALPGFIDIMTAVNNDVAAVFVVSAFLWMGIRLVKRGFSWFEFVALLALAGLSYFTKNTTLIVLPILPVVLLFAFLRGKLRRWAWLTMIFVLVGGLLAGFYWGETRSWYRTISQLEPTRSLNDSARHGEYVFKLTTPIHKPVWLPQIFQLIPLKKGIDLQGKTVTLGAWIWADQAAKVSLPALNIPNQAFYEVVNIQEIPQFYAFQVKIPDDAERIWVSLANAVSTNRPVQVYFDGVIMVEGEYPIAEIPQFAAVDGAQGIWGDRAFDNLLRNGSAEAGFLGIKPWLDNLGAKILPDDTRLSIVLNSLFDWSALSYYYIFAARHLFETFWARFGWGHVPLIGQYSYLLPLILMGLTFIGVVMGLWRRRRRPFRDLVLVFGLFLSVSWGITFMRFLLYFVPRVFLPVARHSSPSIIVSVLVLAFGWLEIVYLVSGVWQRLNSGKGAQVKTGSFESSTIIFKVSMSLFVSVFILLDIWSLVSVINYYGWL